LIDGLKFSLLISFKPWAILQECLFYTSSWDHSRNNYTYMRSLFYAVCQRILITAAVSSRRASLVTDGTYSLIGILKGRSRWLNSYYTHWSDCWR